VGRRFGEQLLNRGIATHHTIESDDVGDGQTCRHGNKITVTPLYAMRDTPPRSLLASGVEKRRGRIDGGGTLHASLEELERQCADPWTDVEDR
jgi:hypothetical protein